MTSNDRIILDQVLEQRRQSTAAETEAAYYFEFFTAEQILKDYDLNDEEIASGIVAGSGDGGIDSFYVFVNGELLQDDSDFSDLRKNIVIDVVLIQSKTTAGFAEPPMDRFAAASEDLFDLAKHIDSLYNAPRNLDQCIS